MILFSNFKAQYPYKFPHGRSSFSHMAWNLQIPLFAPEVAIFMEVCKQWSQTMKEISSLKRSLAPSEKRKDCKVSHRSKLSKTLGGGDDNSSEQASGWHYVKLSIPLGFFSFSFFGYSNRNLLILRPFSVNRSSHNPHPLESFQAKLNQQLVSSKPTWFFTSSQKSQYFAFNYVSKPSIHLRTIFVEFSQLL